jgi:hypothetical protein
MTRLDEVLGLLALAGYIVGIVGLAAAITWVVIRIFPTERNPTKPEGEEKPAKESKPTAKSGETGGGTLFRRSKRRG